MRRIKINIVLGHELPFPQTEGGGVNSLIMQIINGFDKNKTDIAVYSPLSESLEPYEVIDGVQYIRVKGADRKKTAILNILAGIPYAIRVLIKMRKADILFSHFWHGFFFTFTQKVKIKTHTVHRDPNKALFLFRGFDKVFFGSDSVSDEAKVILPSMSEKFEVVYNCVDFNGYKNSPERKSDGLLKFLYIGRFSEDKGLESFIHGFKLAHETNSHVRFKTIGPLDYKGGSDEKYIKRIKQFISDNNLDSCIDISGPIYNRSKLDEQIKENDVIVLPSIYGETLNMVILESMRIGRPILISDLDANKPLIEEGVTGVFCERNNSNSWFNGIMYYAQNINTGEIAGQKVFEFGKAKFSSEIISNEYLDKFILLLSNE